MGLFSFNRIKNDFVKRGLEKLVDALNDFTDEPHEREAMVKAAKGFLNLIDEESEREAIANKLAAIIPTPFLDGTPQEKEFFENALEALHAAADAHIDQPLLELAEKLNTFLQELESKLADK